MAIQILIGTLMIAASILIMVCNIAAAAWTMSRIGEWFITGRFYLKLILSLSLVTFWLLAGISVTVWLWAALFVGLGAFPDLEPALYFSIVSLTTLGFGDIILSPQWRLLSGFIATSGLVLFGLNTAFLIEAVVRLSAAREAVNRKK